MWIMRIGVAVEYIDYREPARRDGDPGDILLSGELVRSVLDRLLLAAEAEGLPHEDTGDVYPRHWEVRFLRFTVGKASDSQRVVEAKALHEFRVDIDFGAVPRSIAEVRRCARRILDLIGARQAIRTFIGRSESGIALLDEGKLPVDIPAAGVDCP